MDEKHMRQFNPCLTMIFTVKLRNPTKPKPPSRHFPKTNNACQPPPRPLHDLSEHQPSVVLCVVARIHHGHGQSRRRLFSRIFRRIFFGPQQWMTTESRGLRRNLMVVLTHVFSPLLLSSFLPNRRLFQSYGWHWIKLRRVFCHTGDWHQINNVDNISSTLLHKNPHLINQQYYLSLNVRMLRKETQITLRLIFSPNPWTTRDVWKPSESQSNTRPSLVFHHQYFAKYFTHLYNNCACSEAWIRGWSGHGPVNGSSHALRQLEFGHGGKDVTCDVQPRRVQKLPRSVFWRSSLRSTKSCTGDWPKLHELHVARGLGIELTDRFSLKRNQKIPENCNQLWNPVKNEHE